MKKRADDDVLLLAEKEYKKIFDKVDAEHEKEYKKIFDKVDAEHPEFSVKVKHLKTHLRLQP
jgi:hypothetical protein